MRRTTVLVLAVGLSVFGPPASAQTIRGLVTRADSGAPLAGALVELVGADGERIAAVLSGPEGRYSLPHGALSGNERVRVSFVGMSPLSESAGALRAGETFFLDLRLEARAVELGGLSVVAEERCGGDAFEAVAIGRIWAEARTALESIEWAVDASTFRYDVETHVRRLDPRGRRVLSESRRELPAWGAHPFRSPDPETLSRAGYVQDVDGATMYYAPDVDALLSDGFIDTHCFAMAPARSDEGWVGLSFRPIDGRDVPDILGTFWLDAESNELRELTFRYAGLSRDIDTSELGGRIDFGTVEGGGWIVEAWAIRMPVVGLQSAYGSTDRREVITALEEQGGEVRRVRRSGAAIWSGEERGVIRGRVEREASDASPSGVEVRIAGTPYVTRTNERGDFAIRGLRDGVYEVQAFDPVLDVLGLDTVRTPARPMGESGSAAPPGERVVVRLPSIESDLARRCGSVEVVRGDGVARQTGALSGTVLDELSGVPVPGAAVRVSWHRVDRIGGAGFDGALEWTEVASDRAGRFAFCVLPARHEITVLASAFGRTAGGVDVRLPPGGVRDVRLTLAAGDPIAVTGRVTAASGEPLGGAEVRMGPWTTLSADDGRFGLGGVAPGVYPLEVSHLGRASRGDSVRVSGAAENHVEVTLPEPAFELEGLAVEVTRGPEPRYRARGTRVDVMTRDEIEAVTYGQTSIAGVLQHAQVPGLQAFERQFPWDGDRNYKYTRLGICVQLARNAGVGCRMPEVYLNGARLAEPQFGLLSIDVTTLDRIEVLPAAEAQTQYPFARYGVLLLFTR